MADKTTLNAGLEDDKMNRKHDSLLNNNKKDTGGFNNMDRQQPNSAPPQGAMDGPMGGQLMNFTQMLESLDEVSAGLQAASETPGDDLTAAPVGDMSSETPMEGPSMGMGGKNDEELLNELNQIFTPILVMQGFEGDLAGRIQEAFSEASVLVERNVINFDDSTRMAQLISVCALLIAREKNSEKYQVYAKAAQIRNQAKLDIQKEEYAAAQALAQKFLVKVSTTNNSSVARSSAQNLLPQTQH